MDNRSALAQDIMGRFQFAGLPVVIGLLFLSLASPFAAACSSTANLQAKIEAKVKPGASIGEIDAFLSTDGKGLGIEPGGDLLTASSESVLTDRQVPPDTQVYRTIRRGNPSYTIYFLLDHNMRFERLIIIKDYTGP